MSAASHVLRCEHECVAQITDAHHLPGSPQRWPTVDRDVKLWVNSIRADASEVLGDSLVGVYLHGSLAMGCYYRPKSDLDLLIVCQDSMAPGLPEDIASVLLGASDRRPTTGDIETSVMRLAHTKELEYPSPFEVHFGSEHAEAIRHGRADYGTTHTDSDLAAHCKVVRSRGVRLLGEEIENVFGSVPDEAYRSSIRAYREAGNRSLTRDLRGGPGGNRTHDLRIKSPLLCLLSYRPEQTLPAVGVLVALGP